MFTKNLLCFALCSSPQTHLLGVTGKSLALSSLQLHSRYLYTLIRAFSSLGWTVLAPHRNETPVPQWGWDQVLPASALVSLPQGQQRQLWWCRQYLCPDTMEVLHPGLAGALCTLVSSVEKLKPKLSRRGIETTTNVKRKWDLCPCSILGGGCGAEKIKPLF